MPDGITLDGVYEKTGAEIYPPHRIILIINDLQVFNIAFVRFFGHKGTKKTQAPCTE